MSQDDRLARLSPEKRALLALRLRKGDATQLSAAPVPRLQIDPERRHEPFPLTPVQETYWLGRDPSFVLGNVACLNYVEFEIVDVDISGLEAALNRLIGHHEMLRAVVLPSGEQKILEHVPPYVISAEDLRGQSEDAVASRLEEIRHRMSHANRRTEEWPLFEMRATRLETGIRLHFVIEVLIADGDGVGRIFRDLLTLYGDPDHALPVLDVSFRDYVLALAGARQGAAYERSREYWMERLPTLPPAPALALARSPESVDTPRFRRLTGRLETRHWAEIKRKATHFKLTTASVVSAAFSYVLARWSQSPRFALTVTLFNRLPVHPRIGEIVGDFTTLTILEVNAPQGRGFTALAKEVQEQMWRDLDHREFSAVEVVRALAQREGVLSAARPVVLTIIGDRGSEAVGILTWAPAGPHDPSVRILGGVNATPQVWLDHQVFETPDGALQWNWDHVPDLFPEGLIEAMFEAYVALLTHLAGEQGLWDEELPSLLPPRQREQRAAVNATGRSLDGRLLQQPFQEQAARAPERPAIIAMDRTISYRELLGRVRRLGRVLRDAGARPNMLVAIVMEKGWEQVVAALGILESGAAYLPIDASLPRERLWHLLEHAEVGLVLTQAGVDSKLEWPSQVRRFAVDREGLAEEALTPVQAATDLAYVIYTSGSTGLPKGVMIDHRGALNTVLDVNRRFEVGPEDRVLALSSLSFDLSVWDIFGTLAAGGAIVLPDASRLRDAAHWAELVIRTGVTVWNSVPALMSMLLEYAAGRDEACPRSLRTVLLSGDWIPVGLPDRIREIAKGADVIGLGGATEASIWSILYPIGAVDPTWKSIPYGMPMDNQSFYVLDEALEPRPVWTPGHLYIGGIGVAQGYWRDEEKTRVSFLTHPKTGERLYRTGDLGRYLPDGNIEFLGRDDFQVKIQGNRIELGEIEAALAQHPGVQEVAVAAVGRERDRRRLVGYVVPSRPPAPSGGELRRFLTGKLPDYMVPSAFVILERLPLTANGKVDRAALPDPAQLAARDSAEPVSGSPANAEAITRIVRDTLGVERIDLEANLLSLGANSLDMIRIGNELERQFGVRLRIDELFRAQSVAGLAALLDRGAGPPRVAEAVSVMGGDGNVRAYLRSEPVLLDPESREAFKSQQPGIRRDDAGRRSLALPELDRGEAAMTQYKSRRTHRTFSLKPIPLPQFGKLLGFLSPVVLEGKPKYLYGSAGGLYPIQVYLHVKTGRVEDVIEGAYYYHALEHRLVALRPGAELDRSIHVPFVNAPIFDEAAFSLFLVAQLSAIVPAYGEESLHLATLEAGLMAQLLETEAPTLGIGLCQIGGVDFGPIRDSFVLDSTHVLVHSLLGGPMVDGTAGGEISGSVQEGEAARAARLKKRIDLLTPEEVKALLEAHRPNEARSKPE